MTFQTCMNQGSCAGAFCFKRGAKKVQSVQNVLEPAGPILVQLDLETDPHSN